MTHQDIVVSINTAQIATLPPYQRLCWILTAIRAASITQDRATYDAACYVQSRLSVLLGQYKRGRWTVEQVVEGVVTAIEQQRSRMAA